MENNYREELVRIAGQFADEDAGNYIAEEIALRPELAGMRIFERPILAVADAVDPLFEAMNAPDAIGEHFVTPRQWLPDAKSVISLYFPFTEPVVQTNSVIQELPSQEWLHARIEGQLMLNATICELRDYCEKLGYSALIPIRDKRFWAKSKPAKPGENGGVHTPTFTSNWSERHVACICGLGTFGLSRQLITKKGTAGRFGSLVTSMPLEPDSRPYSRYDEYCSRCGSCIRRCPVNAITEDGKDQVICGAYNDKMLELYKPRYGCGKCSTGVPCQSRSPVYDNRK